MPAGRPKSGCHHRWFVILSLSHMSMVVDLLVHQGREQGHARDRGSHQEVPHGLPPAEVLQRADDQEAWDTSGTYMAFMHTMNASYDWIRRATHHCHLFSGRLPRRLPLHKKTAAQRKVNVYDSVHICHGFPMLRAGRQWSRMSLTHGGNDGSRPVDDPGNRAQGTRARKLGVSGKVNRHGRRDDVVGPECVNKAIEIEIVIEVEIEMRD